MTVSGQPIVVIGGGGHAKVLLHMLSRLEQFRVLGYVDPRNQGTVLGYPRLGGDDALPVLAEQAGIGAVIGVGKVKAGRERLAMAERLKALGFALPAIVAPTAMIAREVALGEGTVVMDGVIVQPGSAIGRLGILNSGCVLDHDCVLGDDVHVAPRAVLSGNVSVGEGSMIGAGAALKHGVRIGSGCTIGVGAAVVSDCLEPGVYVGVPARRSKA